MCIVDTFMQDAVWSHLRQVLRCLIATAPKAGKLLDALAGAFGSCFGAADGRNPAPGMVNPINNGIKHLSTGAGCLEIHSITVHRKVFVNHAMI